MDAAVAVEIAPDTEALTAALLETCSRAVVGGGCTLGPAQAAAVATVTWASDEHLAAHVRVVMGSAVREDDVRFGATDAMVERFRALGLVVALLVGDARATAAASPPAEPPPKPPPPSPPPPVAAAPPRARPIALDVAPFVGPALDEGSWRIGGMLRVAWSPRPWGFVEADGRGSARPTDGLGLSAQSVAATLGAGAALHVGVVRLAVRVGFGFAWLRAGVDAGGETDASALVVGLARTGVEVALRLAAGVALFVGADVEAHLRVPVEVRGVEVAAFPAVTPVFLFGLRIAP